MHWSIRPRNEDVSQLNNYYKEFELSYGKKLDQESYIKISLPYIFATEDSIDYSTSRKNTTRSNSLQEPAFTFSKRITVPSGLGETIRDVDITYTPALTHKKVGGDNANQAVGGHRLNISAGVGAIYEYWESLIAFDLHHQFGYVEQNTETNVDYTYEPVTSFSLRIDLQYAINRNWFINASSGLDFNQTFDIRNEETNELSTLQRGTGSSAKIGALYRNLSGVFELKVIRSKNDYFIENSKSQNLRGDSRQLSLEFDYSKFF